MLATESFLFFLIFFELYICHKFNHNTRDCFKNPSNLPTDNDCMIAEEFDFGVTNDNANLGNGAIGEV